MASAFPSLSALGGSKCLVGKSSETTRESKSLAELNTGKARMVDTFIYPYDELVKNEQPFALINEQGQDCKIAIVGSGFAGATAAYELKRAFGDKLKSDSITIFEARTTEDKQPIIGGRAHSEFFTDSKGRLYTNEMGPMRVPENSKLFWHYLLKIVQDPAQMQRIFPNPGVVPTQLVYRGVRYTWSGGLGGGNYPQPENPNDPNIVDWQELIEDVFGTNGFIASLKFNNDDPQSIGELLQKPSLNEQEKERIRVYWAHFIEKYEDVSLVSAMNEFFDNTLPGGWSATKFNMFSTLGFGTGGFGPLFPVCFLEIFRLLVWQYDQEYSPAMPMADVVKKLIELEVKGTNEQINILGHTVTYIGLTKDQQQPKPIVSYIDASNGNQVIEQVFDYVVVAAPLRSMQIRINLDANVPPSPYNETQAAVFGQDNSIMIRESMRIPHIMNSSKLFGFLAQKPWVDNQDWPSVNVDGVEQPVKCVLTDTLARQMYFLDPYPEDDGAGCNPLISYNWGDDSVQIMGIRNYEQGQYVNSEASPNYTLKMAYQNGLDSAIENSPIARSLEQITVENQSDTLRAIVWQEEPMIFGAFKIDNPQQYYYTAQLVYQYQQIKTEPNCRVFLAGNNVSFQGGWIEGAMQSAVNAASAILKSMDAQGFIQQGSMRMDSLFEENPFAATCQMLAYKYKIS